MKKLQASLNQGIEGFLTEDPSKQYKLPKNKAIPVSGGRITMYLERHFDQMLNRKDFLVEQFIPKFLSRNVTAPLAYRKRYKKTKQMLEDSVESESFSDSQKEQIKLTLGVMQSLGKDLDLLNNYVTSLQKV